MIDHAPSMVRLSRRLELRLLAIDAEVLRLLATGDIRGAIDRAAARNLLSDLVPSRDRVLDHAYDPDFLRVLRLERELGHARDAARQHAAEIENRRAPLPGPLQRRPWPDQRRRVPDHMF